MKIGMSFTGYEAELNTDCCDRYNNAELTIKLRMGFKQINPSGGNAEGTYHDYGDATETARKIIKWTPASWSGWKSGFIRSARSFWHGKFWLVNNFSKYEFEDGGVKYRPNVWCRFELVEDAKAAHHTIDVVRLHHTENFFGSHSTLYDSKDTNSIRKGRDSAGNAIMQRAHVHEVGHLLGLGHVDEGKAHCPAANTNSRPCYGVADDDKNSVMGMGMQLRVNHANPWRKALCALSGEGWTATLTDWEAKLKRHYPRTMAEVAANQAITLRPRR